MSLSSDRRVQILVAVDGEVDRDAIAALVADAPGLAVLDYLELDGPSSSSHGNGEALVVAAADYSTTVRAFVAAACRQHPQRPIVLVCPIEGSHHVGDVLDSGIDDIIGLPLHGTVGEELQRQLTFAVRKAIIRRERGTVPSETTLGTVICVLGLKGGSGKTLTATNLAVSLAQSGHRTALLDLDLQFGDVALSLGVNPHRTIYDLVSSGGSLDAEKLEAFLVTHSSGVRALLAPTRPDQAAVVTVAFLDEVQRLLARTHEFVVIDTPPSFSAEVISAIDYSTDVLVVAMRDTLSLKNTRLGLETLERMEYDPDHVRIVLNRANTNVGIEREDVLAIIGREVDTVLPSSRDVAASVNSGTPIALQRGSAAGAAFRSLAALYVEQREPAEAEPAAGRHGRHRPRLLRRRVLRSA